MLHRMLQIILVIIGLIAVITGAMGLAGGVGDPYYGLSQTNHPGRVVLDSNMRYFSGFWFSAGLVLFWIAQNVKTRKTALRMLAVMVFAGAIGRIISIIDVGPPSATYLLFTFLEFIFPILLILQNKVAAAK